MFHSKTMPAVLSLSVATFFFVQLVLVNAEGFPWDWIGKDLGDLRTWINNLVQKGIQQGIQQEDQWGEFKSAYGRNFTNWFTESEHRDTWQETNDLIKEHNSLADEGLSTYWMSHNNFSDMSESDQDRYLLSSGPPDSVADVTPTPAFPSNTTPTDRKYAPGGEGDEGDEGWDVSDPITDGIPETLDYRKAGLVTEVQAQGRCNSCASFASLGSLEAQWAKKTGSLIRLSAQQVVDCGDAYGVGGCLDGAWMTDVFHYIQDNGGVDSNDCYPYIAKAQSCAYNASCEASNLTSWGTVKSGNETELMQVVANVGPVAVAIGVDRNLLFYKSGIYSSPNCSNKIMHALLVIGYGTENGTDYWLVKNSWGPRWGNRGYGKIIRNSDFGCYIATYAAYAIL